MKSKLSKMISQLRRPEGSGLGLFHLTQFLRRRGCLDSLETPIPVEPPRRSRFTRSPHEIVEVVDISRGYGSDASSEGTSGQSSSVVQPRSSTPPWDGQGVDVFFPRPGSTYSVSSSKEFNRRRNEETLRRFYAAPELQRK